MERYQKLKGAYIRMRHLNVRLMKGYQRGRAKVLELEETVAELEQALHEALDLAATAHSQAQELKAENARLRMA